MSQANRGMALEEELNYTNRLYEQKGIALINKRPTPMKIIGKTKGNQHICVFNQKSTTDYDGVYQGRSIVFEAKSVSKLERFDLKNLHEHQAEYLLKCHRLGAISFLLVEFTKQRTIYLMPAETLEYFWNRKQKGGKGTQSIPIDEFDIHAYEVSKGRVPIDYLEVVRKVWKIDVMNKAVDNL